ncbi:MAG: glycerate kinase type-2 family protein [Pirellula sp.]
MEQVTQDALRVWQAGVDAVRADRVVREQVRWDGRILEIQQTRLDLAHAKRWIIVGAGKAAGGMLEGVLEVLEGTEEHPRICGWINLPEGSIPERLKRRAGGVEICEARPAGVNEPTAKVVDGTKEILRLVDQATSEDVVLFLLSGGGSALLCAPVEWMSLETKVAITRRLSSRGARIQELNAVRRAISQVKGGGLARRSRAVKLITLVISDVLGDPLEMIGSGPTVLEPAPDSALAARILQRYAPDEFPEVVARLSQPGPSNPGPSKPEPSKPVLSHPGKPLEAQDQAPGASAHTFVLANNATAVEAAVREAHRLGYRVQSESRVDGEGTAEQVGLELAAIVKELEPGSGWISGGEPTVVLPDVAVRGVGGRNQHVVLKAGSELLGDLKSLATGGSSREIPASFALVSGGTDGEDGATQAAGAWIDHGWLDRSLASRDRILDALARCDSNTVLSATGHVLLTGPTHTNVCDLRVVLRGT